LFKKKPVVIEALQFVDKKSALDILEWARSTDIVFVDRLDTPWVIEIRTLEGVMEASLGDWVIKGIQGEFYPCKPDIFVNSYEPVSSDD
jgi:hypothetical protein